MHLHQTGNYHQLQYLLNAGSILTRFRFNVGAKHIGFNAKNKKTRVTAIHPDTVRKFFKDTNSDEIRAWYGNELQHWFHAQRAFNNRGIFVLDQSHLVVPNNKNYQNAVKMPVDEHGPRYKNLSTLTEEQKQAMIYHPCYTISTLLTFGPSFKGFHIAGYELGSGNEDELVQARRLVPNFCCNSNGLMKLLIVDRGYIDHEFINQIKHDHAVDVLIPLRKNMDDHVNAVELATMRNSWQVLKTEYEHGHLILKQEIALVSDFSLWKNFKYKIYAIVTKYTI